MFDYLHYYLTVTSIRGHVCIGRIAIPLSGDRFFATCARTDKRCGLVDTSDHPRVKAVVRERGGNGYSESHSLLYSGGEIRKGQNGLIMYRILDRGERWAIQDLVGMEIVSVIKSIDISYRSKPEVASAILGVFFVLERAIQTETIKIGSYVPK
jgi:hypothetical protein